MQLKGDQYRLLFNQMNIAKVEHFMKEAFKQKTYYLKSQVYKVLKLKEMPLSEKNTLVKKLTQDMVAWSGLQAELLAEWDLNLRVIGKVGNFSSDIWKHFRAIETYMFDT